MTTRKLLSEPEAIRDLLRRVRDVEARLGRVGAIGNDWTDYTPTLTAATTNPTLGTGSSQNGRWVQVGSLVVVQVSITFGTSGTAAGSGAYYVSLPAAASSTAPVLGSGDLRDDSTGSRRVASALVGSSTSVTGLVTDDGQVSSSVPWTWAASDSLRLSLTYEAA